MEELHDNDDIDNIDENDDNDDMVAPICKKKKFFITILPGAIFSYPGQLNVSACLSHQAN